MLCTASAGHIDDIQFNCSAREFVHKRGFKSTSANEIYKLHEEFYFENF
jgi:hypothetical protein